MMNTMIIRLNHFKVFITPIKQSTNRPANQPNIATTNTPINFSLIHNYFFLNCSMNYFFHIGIIKFFVSER